MALEFLQLNPSPETNQQPIGGISALDEIQLRDEISVHQRKLNSSPQLPVRERNLNPSMNPRLISGTSASQPNVRPQWTHNPTSDPQRLNRTPAPTKKVCSRCSEEQLVRAPLADSLCAHEIRGTRGEDATLEGCRLAGARNAYARAMRVGVGAGLRCRRTFHEI